MQSVLPAGAPLSCMQVICKDEPIQCMSLTQCNAMISVVGIIRLAFEVEAQDPYNFEIEVLL